MSPTPRILIVCEDKIIAHLASTMLQKKGFGILGILTTGEEALVKSAELIPDLVLMDVESVGQMDGIDAAHYIFQLFHVPVIFISGIQTRRSSTDQVCPAVRDHLQAVHRT